MENRKKEIQDELEKLAPSLAKMKKEEAFEVPENYFSQLSDEIFSQINFSQNKNEAAVAATTVKTTNWLDQLTERLAVFFQPKMAIGYAMMIALVASVYFINNQSTTENPLVADLTSSEIENYVKANIDDFDEKELFDILEDEGSGSWTEMEIEDEDLDEYLEGIIDDLDASELEDLL